LIIQEEKVFTNQNKHYPVLFLFADCCSFFLWAVHDLLAGESSVDLTGLVALDVELDEEQEVRAKDDLTEGPSTPSTTASLSSFELACVVYPEEVQSDVGNELSNLKLGDVFLPEDRFSKSSQEIIVVHEGVNDRVRDSTMPLRSNSPLQAHPAKQERCGVVIDVQEDQWLLFEHQEQGVEEFVILAKIEQVKAEVVRSGLILEISVTKESPNTTIRSHLVSFVKHV